MTGQQHLATDEVERENEEHGHQQRRDRAARLYRLAERCACPAAVFLNTRDREGV